ncbi:MAG TPA: DUF2267 domain-containing protein [Polyangiaceae bacterium]|nr:DUF2267 domain-containing protein [Polyangiaceae bacterium]
MMNRAEFIERVEGFANFGPGEAEAAVVATLEALGAALTSDERRSLASQLPEELRELLDTAREHAPELNAERFYALVQRHEKVRAGRAREHAQIVCRVVSEVLTEDEFLSLTRHVPWLELLLRPPDPSEPAPALEMLRRRDPTNTLAGGRPGSRSPLATARPDRTQSQSVAATDEPHRDTKISSSSGTTQERERETLASGRPGSKRPLAGSS